MSNEDTSLVSMGERIAGVTYYSELQTTTSPRWRSPGWWLGVFLIALIVVVSFWLAVNPVWIIRFGSWGYAGAFVISMIASATIVLPAPGIAVVIAMSAALDPILLGLVAGVGSAIGELSGYFVGASGRAFVPTNRQVQFERIHNMTDRHGPMILFALAALPLPFFDFAGIVAGILRMHIASFLTAVALGKSIKYIVLILLGTAPLYWLQQLFTSGGAGT